MQHLPPWKVRCVGIEALYPDRLEEHYTALAHHFSQGELWDKACFYWRHAGARAFARSALREAMACFEQALTTLHHVPENQAQREQAEAFYRQAIALADELGMRPLLAHCHGGLGILYNRIGRPEQARTELSAAIELYRAMEMMFWLERAETALVQVRERGT